ncbi:DUF3017 domain-containing protein [Cellulomonas sp. ACRRI]|uniref:DUF3017 domain-containing protein n=1 Tax=Cellulomonas sp. ACRRI TaxID=2918188 RepID=UPI001EF33273|nr:DUF3017 domain-containing protein [Cellulomonas sp. ACRRI]MCG7288464.1 DUF3017 domain-containing protein [Cellulomonas sp. ACRRI]
MSQHEGVPPATGDRPSPEDERFGPDGEPLDPRAIARASLAADRNWSLWVIAGAVLFSVALALAAGTPAGALALAGFLGCCAVVRAVVRRAPAALVVRRRAVDVAVLAGLAVTIGVLSQIVPAPSVP